jgi:hypothetical protein
MAWILSLLMTPGTDVGATWIAFLTVSMSSSMQAMLG